MKAVDIETIDTYKKNSKQVIDLICQKNGLRAEFGSGLDFAERNNGMFYSFGFSYEQLFREMVKFTAAS
jgi:hypothetical protein